MWGVFDIAQDGTAEMNTLFWTVNVGLKTPAVIIGPTDRDSILTKLQALNLIIMLTRGKQPWKEGKSGKRDTGIC